VHHRQFDVLSAEVVLGLVVVLGAESWIEESDAGHGLS